MSIGRIDSVMTCGATGLVVQWDDGRRAAVDLAAVIAGSPALAALADSNVFHHTRLAADGWSVEWPSCGIDFGAAQLRRWADEQAGGTTLARDHAEFDRVLAAMRAIGAPPDGVQPRPPFEWIDRPGL